LDGNRFTREVLSDALEVWVRIPGGESTVDQLGMAYACTDGLEEN
jgi:hypothetical protein